MRWHWYFCLSERELGLLTGWLGGELVNRLGIGVDVERTRTRRVHCHVRQSVNLNKMLGTNILLSQKADTH